MELSDTQIILKPWQLRHILEEAVDKGMEIADHYRIAGVPAEVSGLAVKELFDRTLNGTS